MIDIDIKLHKISYRDKTENTITLYTSSDKKPLVLLLPAMGIRASYYGRFAKYIAGVGDKNLATLDYRGHGFSSIRPSRHVDFGFKEWLEDIHEVILFLHNEYPDIPIELLGHSIGGQLGCLYYAAHPEQIDNLTIIGSSLPYYKIWKGWGYLKLWFGAYFSVPISKLWGYFPGHLTGFAGKESQTVMRDWAHVTKTGKYIPLHSKVNYEKRMQELSPNLHAISFPQDNLAPPYTVPYLLEKFGGQENINHSIIDGFDHFNWVKRPKDFSKWLY